MKKYIKADTDKEETFVRFGKRFKHGKSINYLAMNPRIKEEYSYKLAELQYGYIDEDEFNKWCEEALEDFVWEPHTSCFYCDIKTNLPIVNNVSQAKTLIGFIQRFEENLPCQSFLVKGNQVGVGTDKEPLVDVTQEEEINYNIDDLIHVVLNTMKRGFQQSQYASDSTDDFIHLRGDIYQYKNMIFAVPKMSFIQDYEYKGRVMDKFKFEEEVSVDYDNIVGAHIDADANGGKQDIMDCICEWGDDIYQKPFYFENKFHIAINIDERTGDIDICGSENDVDDFLYEYPIDYETTEPDYRLEERFRKMKFYE